MSNDKTIVKVQKVDASAQAEGKEIAQHNPRFAQFALMLTHPEFAEFFDQNFQSWHDCKTSIMLLKTGSMLRDKIKESTGQSLSGLELLTVMKRFLDEPNNRSFMSHMMQKFSDDTPQIKPSD